MKELMVAEVEVLVVVEVMVGVEAAWEEEGGRS